MTDARDAERVVELRPLPAEEWDAWAAASEAGYVEQLERLAGQDRAAATAKARRDFALLLPDGPATPGQHVHRIEVDGTLVGHLWLRERHGGEDGRCMWVSDVEVLPAHRGRGYGRAAMLAAEDVARRHGFGVVGLNVFRGNGVAIRLYTALGYEVTRRHELGQNMRKVL